MVNTFSRVFMSATQRPDAKTQRHLPMLNEITTSLSGYYQNASQVGKKKTLMRWYKSIPELTALVNKVARDGSANYHFETIDGKDGRNRIIKANRFAQQIRYRGTKFAQWVDKLVTGEAFGWIGKLSEAQLKEKFANAINSRGLVENKTYVVERFMRELKAVDELGVAKGIDEDIKTVRKYRYMASSTMEVVYDAYDVQHYTQWVKGLREDFKPEEVIRSTFMDVDGKVNGFSPVEAIIVQLELLRFMWQNMVSIHRNGGSPDKLFVLEDMKDVNSPAYHRIEQQLEKYKLVENKHGNMLFTGKVNVQELNQLDKMQFMDMGLYVTGLIAMQWSIPRSSIPYIVGGTNTKDDTGGNSEKGYWDNVEYCQMLDAEVDNTQLWIPYFGVKLVYDKVYVQKDVQIQTSEQLMLNNLVLKNQLLGTLDKQLNKDALLKELGYSTKDLEEMKEDPVLKMTLDKQLSDDEVNDSEDKKNIKDKKKIEQEGSNRSAGKPTGTGKEKKELSEASAENVDFTSFIKFYNEDKAYHPGKSPRVLVRKNSFFTTYRYKSSDFTYMSVLRNEDIEDNRINLMSLTGNMYEV